MTASVLLAHAKSGCRNDSSHAPKKHTSDARKCNQKCLDGKPYEKTLCYRFLISSVSGSRAGYLGIGSEHPRVVDRLEIIRKPQLSVLYSVRPGPFVDLKLPMGTLEDRKETERRREREIEADELTDF